MGADHNGTGFKDASAPFFRKNIYLHKNSLSLLFRGLIMPSDDIYKYLFDFQGDRSVNVHF